MANLEDLKEQAKRKVEAEMTEPDSPIGQIGMICLTWIDYADNAAEMILGEGKTLAGAYEEIRKYAQKNQKSGQTCVEPTKTFELVLEYFGQDDPKGIIEGGLMYRCMMAAAARFKPYGADSAEELPKPQPVAEKPQQKKSMSALDALNLEDFGL